VLTRHDTKYGTFIVLLVALGDTPPTTVRGRTICRATCRHPAAAYGCGRAGRQLVAFGRYPKGSRPAERRGTLAWRRRTIGEAAMGRFEEYFAELKDPRGSGARRHDLLEILTIALCAILSGGQNVVDMARYAEAKQDFLRRFVRLKNGVPSHDTFSRVFRRLDPEQFCACFRKFSGGGTSAPGGVIAIDGKVIRRSFSPQSAKSALRMVSAWCCDRRMVLAQIATPVRSAETAAVARLLGMLSLDGSIVTADARNCQRDIAWQIVGQGGNYALALKRNHPRLYADVGRLFEEGYESLAGHSVVDSNHGRVETRTSLVASDIAGLQRTHRWPGLAAVGRVLRTRQTTVRGARRTTAQTAYYLLSSRISAERLSDAVRAHWGVENRLHWMLNVVMNEDRVKSRLDNSPYNLAILRHMALNLMQRDGSPVSLRSKFNLAAWKEEFLADLLGQA
jgi:predicted transposase YbfD/YdcC